MTWLSILEVAVRLGVGPWLADHIQVAACMSLWWEGHSKDACACGCSTQKYLGAHFGGSMQLDGLPSTLFEMA